MNFGAVDTCHCMGACISQGAGFYHAYAAGGEFPTVVVTIATPPSSMRDPGLINAVFQGARIILVILDNGTTAMTATSRRPSSASGPTEALAEGPDPRSRPRLGRETPQGGRGYDVEAMKPP
jgi:indolepyruvate ferredoxin oxidoreductase alpha subunit